MPFRIVVCEDISLMHVDAVVNAANPCLANDGFGVCGALFRGAGEERMAEACAAIGGCPVGGAVATPGFDLPAKYVIHAVGPVWEGGRADEERQLLSCYASALDLAADLGASSIALPLVATGLFGVPVRLGFDVACRAVAAFLGAHDQDVLLVVPERRAFDIGEALYSELERRIDDGIERRGDVCAAPGLAAPGPAGPCLSAPGPAELDEAVPPPVEPQGRLSRLASSMRGRLKRAAPQELGELLGNLDASFSQTLLRLIDERGMSDAEAYRRANISRQLFSKIRSDSGYRPSKQTVLAFAVALELTLPETQDLLGRAGFALSHANAADVIVEYFIERGCYDLFLINEALFAFDQALLGS